MFRSVGSRLALALLVVVTGVLAIVYVVVVPSYQRSLQNQELDSLASSLQKVVLPRFPPEFPRRALFVNEMAPTVDARVAVLDILSDNGPLEPVADSRLDQTSSDLEEDPIALLAYKRGRLSRANAMVPSNSSSRNTVLLATYSAVNGYWNIAGGCNSQYTQVTPSAAPFAIQATTHASSSRRPVERRTTMKNTISIHAEVICTSVLQRHSSSSSIDAIPSPHGEG